MTRKTMLTIDWDYFIPEDPMLDMGHRESMLFIKEMWNIRAAGLLARGVDYKEGIKTNGKEVTFWDEVKEVFDLEGATFILTESHASAYGLALDCEINTIYSFDAHNDVTYAGINALTGDVACDNWLGNLAIKVGTPIEDAYIVYSEETNESPADVEDVIRHNKRLKKRIKFTTMAALKEMKKKTKVHVIHICRSGAWCPPWLDKAFYDFARASGIGYYDSDVVKREWNAEIMERLIAEAAECEKAFRNQNQGCQEELKALRKLTEEKM